MTEPRSPKGSSGLQGYIALVALAAGILSVLYLLYTEVHAATQSKVGELLGADFNSTAVAAVTELALTPFVLFVIFLLVILIAQTIILVRTWRSYVAGQCELNRQKDELLSIVSHQLSTPVSSVKFCLEMMADGDVGVLSEAQKDHIGTMQSSMNSLVDLISLILDVSRIQLGRLKADKKRFDVRSLFKNVVEMMQSKAQKKGVLLTAEIPEIIPDAVLDERLMRMTLQNLLSNAVKYTPEGGEAKLTVRVQGETLYYEVSDTGCGIPKADQPRVFEKLYRASNVQEMRGNGFGLYIAKGAIESQGGTIRFESPSSASLGATEGRTEGKGTTFFVAVPLR